MPDITIGGSLKNHAKQPQKNIAARVAQNKAAAKAIAKANPPTITSKGPPPKPKPRPSTSPRAAIFDAYRSKFKTEPSRVEANILRHESGAEITRLFGGKANIHGDFDFSTFDCSMSGEGTLAGQMVNVYTAAFERVHKRKPSAAELECVMAVGRHESRFGKAVYPGGVGPGFHNHGAVQCCKPDGGACREGSFLSSDSSPTDGGGGNKKYAICFKAYPTDVDGAADLIRIIGKKPLELMRKCGNSIAAFAVGMYLQGYFESFNASKKIQDEYSSTITKIVDLGVKTRERAGRVVNYAIGLIKSANSNAKDRGVKRATKNTISLPGKFGLAAIAAIVAVMGAGGYGYYKVQQKGRH